MTDMERFEELLADVMNAVEEDVFNELEEWSADTIAARAALVEYVRERMDELELTKKNTMTALHWFLGNSDHRSDPIAAGANDKAREYIAQFGGEVPR